MKLRIQLDAWIDVDDDVDPDKLTWDYSNASLINLTQDDPKWTIETAVTPIQLEIFREHVAR